MVGETWEDRRHRKQAGRDSRHYVRERLGEEGEWERDRVRRGNRGEREKEKHDKQLQKKEQMHKK